MYLGRFLNRLFYIISWGTSVEVDRDGVLAGGDIDDGGWGWE